MFFIKTVNGFKIVFLILKYFLFSCFPIIFLSFLFSIGHSPQNKKDFDFLWCVVIIFSAIILLRTLQTWFWRLGWYYQLAEFILIGEICSKPILNNRTSGFYYQIAPSDVLILYAILWYLYWNYAHLETSALSNFALM